MFHVSKKDIGEIVTLTPKIPINATKEECRKTPRVCFSPTIEQCVFGIVGYARNADVTILGAFMALANSEWCPTVYYTDNDLFKPSPVGDFGLTEEHWSLIPIPVYRVGYIDCIKMVSEKRIVLRDTPRYVTYPEHELIFHLSANDRQSLLDALS